MRGFKILYTESMIAAAQAFLPGCQAQQHSWELQELV